MLRRAYKVYKVVPKDFQQPYGGCQYKLYATRGLRTGDFILFTIRTMLKHRLRMKVTPPSCSHPNIAPKLDPNHLLIPIPHHNGRFHYHHRLHFRRPHTVWSRSTRHGCRYALPERVFDTPESWAWQGPHGSFATRLVRHKQDTDLGESSSCMSPPKLSNHALSPIKFRTRAASLSH